MKHLRYARYVWRHKVAVYRAGRMLGVGRWQLLTHDLSKLRPGEWLPYAEWFYGYDGGSWYAAKKLVASGTWYAPGFRADIGDREHAFDVAWLNHQHRSPHHWQFWVLREDSGKVKVLPMPDRYRREMLADWMGAGMAIKGHGLDRATEECAAWYANTTEGRQLHPDTRAWVEQQLGIAP